MEGVLPCHVLLIKMDSWIYLIGNSLNKTCHERFIPMHVSLKSIVRNHSELRSTRHITRIPKVLLPTKLLCGAPTWKVLLLWTSHSHWNTPPKMSAYSRCMGTKWTSQDQGAKSHDVAQERLGQLIRSKTQDPNSLGSIPDGVILRSLEQVFTSTQSSGPLNLSRWRASNLEGEGGQKNCDWEMISMADNHNSGKLTITYILSSFTGLGFSQPLKMKQDD